MLWPETPLDRNQRNLLREYASRWRAVLLDTRPIDPGRACEALRVAYSLAEEPLPREIVVVSSPLEGALLAEMYRTGVFDRRRLDRRAVACQMQVAERGSLDAPLYLLHDYLLNGLGVKSLWRMRGLIATARECGWWWAPGEVCIVTDRPREVHVDSRGLLHNDYGPALRYADGFQVFARHGLITRETRIAAYSLY